jgi:hypothetical protein
MFRSLRPLALAVALGAPLTAYAEPTTTRIETRPYYGATVTLEHGVRVFRPLPPHDRVIINPGGTTPLSLGIEEHRSTSHNHFYDHGGSARRADPEAAPAAAYGGAYLPAYGHRHNRPARHRAGGQPPGTSAPRH